ncbi:hypothetical protein N657DRAFT_404669 [Parathielavia appendiculata]|uniref:Uncharacterized protein n=1 Tax=Parathielavia appendiculata TaxID=2587402 RepID=A0AAN6YYG6_9PEZI|nr:hypothetical protein N657DRAFT_404669 [Parathielavia appendiculata]
MCLQIQEAYRLGDHRLANIEITPPQTDRELALSANLVYVPETSVFGHLHVYIDHHTGEEHEDPGWKPPRRTNGPPTESLPKYVRPIFARVRREDEWYECRRILVKEEVLPLCRTHPIRAELELQHFGRHVFEHESDQAKNDMPVVSLPHLDFIDGFGVFQNSYRTLMGFYFTPAGLGEEERFRPGSIFPIALGPHASDFGDVIKALKTKAHLDAGIVMTIRAETVRVCAFAMCYIGDMPQQAENSGFKGPREHKFCGCCFAASGQRAVNPDVMLKFDHITHGRFYIETLEMQQMLHRSLQTASERKQYYTQWGMAEDIPALPRLSPALDLVMSRPTDAAHSEYNGLGNLMHYLLRDGILTKSARSEYAIQRRTWPFPPGWPRLQSPVHHLSSYKMSHHAQWIVIIPAFLLNWLKREHIRPRFWDQAKNFEKDPIELIIETTAAIAKSTTVLMGTRVSRRDRYLMGDIIYRARYLFNQLCLFAAVASTRSAAASQAGTPGVHVIDEPALQDGVADDSGRALQYQNDTLRPNIHAAVHFPVFAEEYALPINCNTLTGENLHRLMSDFRQ